MYRIIFTISISILCQYHHALAKAYIITGAPGAGKSSIIRELEKQQKKVIHECARDVVLLYEAKNKKLDRNSGIFDLEIANLQLAREKIIFRFNAKEDIFLDRSLLDSLAFIEYYERKVPPSLMKLLEEAKESVRGKFKAVFLIKMLKKRSKYSIESLKDSKILENLIYKIYKKLGLKIIIIEEETVENRVKKILNHVELMKMGLTSSRP